MSRSATVLPFSARHRRVSSWRAVGLVAAPLMAAPMLATGTSHAAPVIPAKVPAAPRPLVALPAAVDVAPTYQQQTTCDPAAKPGPIAFAKLLNETYGTRYYGISRNCNSGITAHSEGRALDWSLDAYKPAEKAIGDAVVTWLTASDSKGNLGVMARRFGINYIIWNKKIWRGYAPERGWVAYTGSHPHDDHIHFTFTWDGAYQRTSWWTGVALTKVTIGGGGASAAPAPPPAPVKTATGYYVLRQGSTGAEVKILQQGLGISADGSFGPQTLKAVKAFQTKHKLTVDGIAGPQVWTKLIALGLVPAKGTTSAPAKTPAKPAAKDPLEQYASVTLRRGSKGAAVTALQKALKITADGSFGPATEAAVRGFQKSKDLAANGVVGREVWDALIGR